MAPRSKRASALLAVALLVCALTCLPQADAGRALAAASQAPTGCINVRNRCPNGYNIIIAYKDGQGYTSRGYYTADAGGSTGRICFPAANRDYGFYVHVTRYGSSPATNSAQELNFNMPDPEGNTQIGGCAIPGQLFTTTYIRGDTAPTAIYRNQVTGRTGTCASLGGRTINVDHLYLVDSEVFELCG